MIDNIPALHRNALTGGGERMGDNGGRRWGTVGGQSSLRTLNDSKATNTSQRL